MNMGILVGKTEAWAGSHGFWENRFAGELSISFRPYARWGVYDVMPAFTEQCQ
jgi:hypothetical protein